MVDDFNAEKTISKALGIPLGPQQVKKVKEDK